MTLIEKKYGSYCANYYFCDHPKCDRQGFDQDFTPKIQALFRWAWVVVDYNGPNHRIDHYCYEHTGYGRDLHSGHWYLRKDDD